MNSNLIQELEVLFIEAGNAHHRAFYATNGEDADWARWYADYLLERINALLNGKWTVVELAEILVKVEEQRKSPGVGDWPKFYAEYFVRQFSHTLAT